MNPFDRLLCWLFNLNEIRWCARCRIQRVIQSDHVLCNTCIQADFETSMKKFLDSIPVKKDGTDSAGEGV